jgi:hypothetical protein
MVDNVIVKKGVSGRPVLYDTSKVELGTVADELALLSIGDWEPLRIKINYKQFQKEIKEFDSEWVDYLPREDRPNNRLGLAVTNLPGKTHQDNPSLAQACVEAGRRLHEADFNVPTEAYDRLPSLHTLLEEFSPLGRTF